MPIDPPLVSVIIPAFDSGRYIAAAIESVLRQRHPRTEILVIDDGSTDDTRRVVASFGSRIQLLTQEHGGVGRARNRGIAEARGDLVAFLDADDLWSENKLERQVDFLVEHPGIDLVAGHVVEFRSDELPTEVKQRLAPHEGSIPGVLAGSILIRRPALDRVGPFRENLRVAEFVEWSLRCRELGLTLAMLPEVVLHRRLHTTNLGVRERHSRAEYARVLKRSLDRRRGRAPEDTPR